MDIKMSYLCKHIRENGPIAPLKKGMEPAKTRGMSFTVNNNHR